MKSQRFVYLDNNATTQVAPEVVDAMVPFFNQHWGNPSSAYSFGREVSKRGTTPSALFLGEEYGK